MYDETRYFIFFSFFGFLSRAYLRISLSWVLNGERAKITILFRPFLLLFHFIITYCSWENSMIGWHSSSLCGRVYVASHQIALFQREMFKQSAKSAEINKYSQSQLRHTHTPALSIGSAYMKSPFFSFSIFFVFWHPNPSFRVHFITLFSLCVFQAREMEPKPKLVSVYFEARARQNNFLIVVAVALHTTQTHISMKL